MNADALALKVVAMFARNTRRTRAMADALARVADAAYHEATRADTDMFGQSPRKMTRVEIINLLEEDNGQGNVEGVEHTTRDQPVREDAGGRGTDGRGQGNRQSVEADRAAADQRTEDRGQRTGNRGQGTGNRGQGTEDGVGARRQPDNQARGAKESTEDYESIIRNRPDIPYDTLSFDEATGETRASSGSSPLIRLAERVVTVLHINGRNIPFYLSTGYGGKKGVEPGKWYPFFGLASDGWMNKLSDKEINDYYGSAELRELSLALDRLIGDVRNDERIPKARLSGKHRDFVNQNLSPAENETSTTREKIEANIADIVAFLREGNQSGAVQEAQGGTGSFGVILTEFRGDAPGAIARLMELKSGEAIGALNHPEIGDIDLIWGEEGTSESNGYGLAKLVKWHPEVLHDLQGIIGNMRVTSRTPNRIQLESDRHKGAVRLEWDNQAKHWLLTAFEKKRSGSGTRTDTDGLARGGDTARSTTASETSIAQPPAAQDAALLSRGREIWDGLTTEEKRQAALDAGRESGIAKMVSGRKAARVPQDVAIQAAKNAIEAVTFNEKSPAAHVEDVLRPAQTVQDNNQTERRPHEKRTLENRGASDSAPVGAPDRARTDRDLASRRAIEEGLAGTRQPFPDVTERQSAEEAEGSAGRTGDDGGGNRGTATTGRPENASPETGLSEPAASSVFLKEDDAAFLKEGRALWDGLTADAKIQAALDSGMKPAIAKMAAGRKADRAPKAVLIQAARNAFQKTEDGRQRTEGLRRAGAPVENHEGEAAADRLSSEFALTRQTEAEARQDAANREAEANGELTKEQIDRERAGFALETQSQPKPQGVAQDLFTADGRATVAARQEALPDAAKASGKQESAGSQQTTLQQLAALATSNTNDNQTVTIAPVSSSAVQEAKEKAGLDIEGYQHTADMYAVRHALNQHGDAKKEANRGQIAIGKDDIVAIPDVVTNPDATVYGAKNERRQNLIAYIKKMPDGTILVVEEVRTGRKTLALASLRKVPAAKDFDSIARTLLSNAQSDGGDGLIIANKPRETKTFNKRMQEARAEAVKSLPASIRKEIDESLDEGAKPVMKGKKPFLRFTEEDGTTDDYPLSSQAEYDYAVGAGETREEAAPEIPRRRKQPGVKGEVLAQLEALKEESGGKLPLGESEREAYAELVEAFYEQAAKDLGITPEALWKAMPLNVGRQVTGEAGELRQPKTGAFHWEMGQRRGLFDLPDIPVTTVSSHPYVAQGKNPGLGVVKRLRDAIREILQEFRSVNGAKPRQQLRNQDTGWDLVIAKDDQNKMVSGSWTSLLALQDIESLAQNAVLAESHEDTRHENPDVQAVHVFFAPVAIDGKTYRARLTIKDYKGKTAKTNLHAVTAVEIENAPLGNLTAYSGSEELQPSQPTTGRAFSIANLLKDSKRDDGGAWDTSGEFNQSAIEDTDSGVAAETLAREFADTERAYGGREAYDKAKKAGKTKLDYRQWVQVRTPRFKKWFGDWEAARGVRQLNETKPLQLDGLEAAADQKAVEALFKGFGTVENQEDGRSVTFPVSMAGKIVRHKGFDVKQVAGAFDRLFAAAVPMASELEQTRQGHKAHPEIEAYHHYVSKFEQDGKTYYIRFTTTRAKAWTGEGKSVAHSSFVSEVSVYEQGANPESAGVRVIDPGLTEGNAPVDDRLAQWLRDGNAEVSQVTDPETGEPKVFYHRSPNVFSTFDSARNGTQNDVGWLGDGFYFYGIEEEGYGYGNNSYAVFLNIREPYYASYEENERLAEENNRDASVAFTEELKENGYDGVYYNENLREETVVFSPNQIKSATDNTGAFAAGDDSILFQSATNDSVSPPNGESAKPAQPMTAARKTELSAFLNGDAVTSLDIEDAPQGGYAAVEAWAADIFKEQGGKATNPEIGDVVLDARSAKTSMAHGGANAAKKIAFAAVKDVIEKGAIIHRATQGREDSIYISAPVDISGQQNIVTVLVRRDPNTQRMYLHSVSLKENLLNPRVSSADAEASERSGSTSSGDISRILQDLLNFKPDQNGKAAGNKAKGYAQPLSSLVLTPSGYREMGSLAIGDTVLSANGEETTVEGIYPQGVQNVFRVILEDGGEARCTADHLWTVRAEGKEDWETIPLEEIIKGLSAGLRYELPEVLIRGQGTEDRRQSVSEGCAFVRFTNGA
jgi:hypothetical protein